MAKRPAGVTLVAVLAWIEGALQILGGALLLVTAGAATSGLPRGVLITVAIVTILIGVVIIIVARGLLHGSNTSRGIVTVFTILSLASGIYSLIQHQLVNGVVTAVIAILILVFLWSRRASEFFRG